MRFESRRAFAHARSASPGRPTNGLPSDIAFLEAFGISRAALATAASRATTEGVDARRALLARGEVSEMLYYVCLARHLGLAFIQDWPHLLSPLDIRTALARGRVLLADDTRARWLLAPAADDLALLLDARALGLVTPSIAITTPSHLSALLRHRAGAAIVYAASHALPERAPRLSARNALTPRAISAVAAMLLGLVVTASLDMRVPADVLGAIFLAGLGFRLAVCAVGLAGHPETIDPPLSDSDLPFYTLLVPLYDEGGMIADLVAALNRLDYPRAKLEVMILVEADDRATLDALTSHRLPVGFRTIALPPGLPRTKPRALNAGMLLARGDLVTVYDAEDRPEPDQLRLAAARFARAPERVACLQARLAIANGASGLLARGIMEHPPQAPALKSPTSESMKPPIESTGKALGNQYALHALRERRAEMAGEMTDLLRRTAYLRQAIVSLDATLAIMTPGFDPASIRPKKPYRKAKLFGAGKLNALVLDALRRGDRPMTTHEVTEAIGAAMGFGPEATAGLKSRVRSNLLYLAKVRGTVVKDGERETARWLLHGP